MVLENLANFPSPPHLHLLAGYATVCREWQPVFEEVNFNTLKIQTNDLPKFDTILHDDSTRRKWLRHLHLRIKLRKYKKQLARVPETEQEQVENNLVFTHSIWDLFEILAKWDIGQTSGINLELSVFSPGDRKNLFGEAGLGQDGVNRFFDSDLTLDLTSKHEMAGPHGFPEVEIISGLSILRRSRRNIDPRALLHILLSLPRVVRVQFEPWHQPDEFSQEDLDRGGCSESYRGDPVKLTCVYAEHAMNITLWPKTLKTISIFENSDAFDRHLYDDLSYVKCPQLGRNLARLSLQLEEIYISNFADARYFLEPFYNVQPGKKLPVWTNLRQITLTSNAIHPASLGDEINDLLQAAGLAARQMPMLEVLEIYNASKESAGVFTYARASESSVLLWKCTWPFELDTKVHNTWRVTAEKLTGGGLGLVQEITLAYDGPSKFIQRMITGESLIHPTSRSRMSRFAKAISEFA